MRKGSKQARHATLYDALEDRIQKHRATGFLRVDDGREDGLPPQTRYAATPRNALAARLDTLPDLLPTPDAATLTKLPQRDLLNAIHGYTANLFETEQFAFRALSETALLAIGIIAEELAAEMIGEHGHLMLQNENGASMTSTTHTESSAEYEPQTVHKVRRIDTDEGDASTTISRKRKFEKDADGS